MVRTTLIAALFCIGGLPIFARSSTSHAKMSDTSFIRTAAQANYDEVQLGKLAQEKASNESVKDFGQKMVTDHSKANADLQPIASKDNITIPNKMNAKDQALYDRLSKLSGSQFDRAYMRAMVKDHQSDVAEFRHESQTAKNADVKSYASKTLPVLQEHLRSAEDTNAKLGASAKK